MMMMKQTKSDSRNVIRNTPQVFAAIVITSRGKKT